MSDSLYRRILWFIVASLLVFMPVAQGAVRAWFLTPALLLINLLFFVWLWRWNNHKSFGPARTPLDASLAAFLSLALLSVFYSVYKNASFYALLKAFSFTGLYYLIVRDFDDAMVKRATLLVIAYAGLLSIYGLLQYVDIFPHPWWRPGRFLAATYVNHNHFAGYLELVIPVAIARLLTQDTGALKTRIFLRVSLAAMIVALLFTQSRGAWLSLFVALLCMSVVLIKRGDSRRNGFSVLFLLAVFVFCVAYLNRLQVSEGLNLRTGFEAEEGSWQTRLKIWQGSFEMARRHPFVGTGIGTFESAFSRFRPEGLLTRANFSHNEYLQAAAEMGLLAPLILAWMVFIILRKGLKKDADLCRIGYTIGVLSLVLHGLVDFNFHIPANMLLCVVFIAFLIKENTLKAGV